MSTSTSQDLSCPRCDAHVRAGADWCTLCYHDLRPAPEVPAPADADAPAASVIAAEPGRHARPAPDAAEPAADGTPALPDAEIALMLEQLAADESQLPLRRLSGQVASPGVKAGFIIGGSILATVLVFVVMTLVGTLL